jgi:hypothetical protein
MRGYGINVSLGGVNYTSYNSTGSTSDEKHINVTLGQQFSFGLHKILGWKKLNAPVLPPVNQ